VKPTEMEEFILLCKKHGVMRAKYEDLEIDFGRTPDAGPDAKKMKELALAMEQDVLTGEQALFGSAPQAVTYEQVQAMIKQVNGG
jgi:hypothetical protein